MIMVDSGRIDRSINHDHGRQRSPELGTNGLEDRSGRCAVAGSGADGGSKNGKAKPGDKTGEAGPGDSNGKAGRISRGGKTGRSGKDGKAGRSGKAGKDGASAGSGKNGGLKRPLYEKELFRLQAELVKLQEWVRAERARIVVVFEGRDAAGKGSTIKRVTQFLNPRIAQIVALPAPTEREQTEWYFQRYIRHLPAGGHIVLFDRSWYNRAGVERVMGSAPRRSTDGSCISARCSSGCSWRTGSCCASTGSPSATRNSSAGSSPGSRTRCGGGSCPRWTSTRSRGGRTTPAARTRCSCTPTSPRRHGTSWRATTSAARGST